jgi:predicted acyl esterase
MAPDIGAKLVMPDLNDYVKRVVMMPMRDGVKLHTVIVVPKAQQRPIMLTHALQCGAACQRAASPSIWPPCRRATTPWSENGYIRVFRTCAASMARKATT